MWRRSARNAAGGSLIWTVLATPAPTVAGALAMRMVLNLALPCLPFAARRMVAVPDRVTWAAWSHLTLRPTVANAGGACLCPLRRFGWWSLTRRLRIRSTHFGAGGSGGAGAVTGAELAIV